MTRSRKQSDQSVVDQEKPIQEEVLCEPKLPKHIQSMVDTVIDLTGIRAAFEKELDGLKAEYLSKLFSGEEIGSTAALIEAKAKEINECLTRKVSYFTKSIPALLGR